MVECLIFTTFEQMKSTLEQLLVTFPHTKFKKVATYDSPYQLGIDLGPHVDAPLFLQWAVNTNNLKFCFSLVMSILEYPQPEWIRRFLARIAIEELRTQQFIKKLPERY